MSDFWIYYQIGLRHVLDINAYDHLLFLIAMTVPYAFKDWKRVLLLVTLFTVGHTIALFLSVFNLVFVNPKLIEITIPITILLTAIYNILTIGKSSKNNSISVIAIVPLFFGIIHGLGFSNYFKSILSGAPQSKILPLTEFALGIETSQVLVVLTVLTASFIAQSVFRFSKRDFNLVLSSLVIGVVIPLIINNEFWNK